MVMMILVQKFSIRKNKVLNALKWLKCYNQEYQEFEIEKDNLNWIPDNKCEAELPIEGQSFGFEEDFVSRTNSTENESSNKDKGPCGENITEQEGNEQLLDAVGTIPQTVDNFPTEKDNTTINAIQQSCKQASVPSVKFPYVATEAKREGPQFFIDAFPWLYPGGKGSYDDLTDCKVELQDWMDIMLYYFKNGPQKLEELQN